MSLRFRCVCGAATTENVSTIDLVWRCPSCPQRWQANADTVSAALAGVTELRKLRRDMAILVGGALLLPVILVVMHPYWLLAAPMLVGGVVLVAGPSYRRRVQRGRDAAKASIGLVAA
ncbi:hypothetical protein [Candidatus Mycobacterium methanotrophicum]|uniref:hypothetical protein n=1 Tax=Candidatus Mycobacterium methanotrophicum TaxID=2943498 RepID=UPI001C58A793|nr:hypothetical protein [Candidatus Mycobacterium methanotrophicum]